MGILDRLEKKRDALRAKNNLPAAKPPAVKGFTIHLKPKNESGRARIAKFIEGRAMPFGGETIENDDGSVDFVWKVKFEKMGKMLSAQMMTSLDRAIAKKDDIEYSVEYQE
jgi:hypothetical protein